MPLSDGALFYLSSALLLHVGYCVVEPFRDLGVVTEHLSLRNRGSFAET